MSPSAPPLRIVIAEDNLPDVLLVREALSARDIAFDMIHFRDGAEAVARLCGEQRDASNPDLILLDLNMPKLSGLEVLSAIRKDPTYNNVPVIILTSSPAPEEQQAAHKLGILQYLQKPSDLYEFIDRVGGAIQAVVRQMRES